MSTTATATYESVERDLDEALNNQDAAAAAAARTRVRLELARIATGPNFDPRRHRAIANILRDVEAGAPPAAPVAPLTTRGGR